MRRDKTNKQTNKIGECVMTLSQYHKYIETYGLD